MSPKGASSSSFATVASASLKVVWALPECARSVKDIAKTRGSMVYYPFSADRLQSRDDG